MSKVIRAILTLALIYGAYTETGIFTALSLLLIFVALESQGWLTKRALDAAYECLKCGATLEKGSSCPQHGLPAQPRQ